MELVCQNGDTVACNRGYQINQPNDKVTNSRTQAKNTDNKGHDVLSLQEALLSKYGVISITHSSNDVNIKQEILLQPGTTSSKKQVSRRIPAL